MLFSCCQRLRIFWISFRYIKISNQFFCVCFQSRSVGEMQKNWKFQQQQKTNITKSSSPSPKCSACRWRQIKTSADTLVVTGRWQVSETIKSRTFLGHSWLRRDVWIMNASHSQSQITGFSPQRGRCLKTPEDKTSSSDTFNGQERLGRRQSELNLQPDVLKERKYANSEARRNRLWSSLRLPKRG